jgi:hypothetical protein
VSVSLSKGMGQILDAGGILRIRGQNYDVGDRDSLQTMVTEAELGGAPEDMVTNLIFNRGNIDCDVVKAIGECSQLRYLEMRECNVSCSLARDLVRPGSVEALSCVESDCSAESLDGIGVCENISRLDLSGTTIGVPVERLLDEIMQMRQLRYLDLEGIDLSDEEIATLAEFDGVEEMHISGAGVTLEGIDIVERMPSLKHLALYRTSVTKGRTDELNEVRSTCVVARFNTRVRSSRNAPPE